MTIAVDWDVSQTYIVSSGVVNTGRVFIISTLWVYQGCSKYSKISNTSGDAKKV